jgi:hypothetical protein
MRVHITRSGRGGRTKRFAIVIGVAALGAALIAVGASADFRTVHDPIGDAECDHNCSASDKRHADIFRATAGHEDGKLRHMIRVGGKFQLAVLGISTDSDTDCEFVVWADRGREHGVPSGEVTRCSRNGNATGRARLDFHRHSVRIVFSERSIGNPQSYGWYAIAFGGNRRGYAFDYVPDYVPTERNYIQHQLAQPAAAAPDVVKYDTYLTLTKDGGGNYHGFVLSDSDRDRAYDPATAVKACMEGRRVVLWKTQPGADRRIGTELSYFEPDFIDGYWWMHTGHDWDDRVRAEVRPKVRDRFVCLPDRAAFHF